jgi:hypothetical protein
MVKPEVAGGEEAAQQDAEPEGGGVAGIAEIEVADPAD